MFSVAVLIRYILFEQSFCVILGGMNWQYFFVTFQIKSLIIKSYITVPAFRHIFLIYPTMKKRKPRSIAVPGPTVKV